MEVKKDNSAFFNNMQKYENLCFRLLIASKSSSVTALFINSKGQDDKYDEVLIRNMNENSFTKSVQEGISLMLATPETAYLNTRLYVLSSNEFSNCKVKEVWKQPFGYVSIAINEDLPYGRFMKQFIWDIIANKRINDVKRKWSINEPNCNNETSVKAISYSKIFTCFICLIFGLVLAMVILMVERALWKPKQSQITNRTLDEIKSHYERIHYLIKLIPK